MSNTSLLEQAKAYVEAQDYISDEARNIAGQAYMEGAKWAIKHAAGIADRLTQFKKGYDDESDLINAGNSIAAGVIANAIRSLGKE